MLFFVLYLLCKQKQRNNNNLKITIMKSYIKNLEFKFFKNFGKQYLTVLYERNGEFNKITFSNPPSWVRDEKSVRKFINN